MESESGAFHEAVFAEYERLAAAEPQRWVRLDALRPPAELHRHVMESLEPVLRRAAAR
jgi:thymidylate kinase